MQQPTSERARLDPFEALPGPIAPRDQRDLMERPFFSLAKSRRIAPILYRSGDTEVQVHAVPEHGMATIWDADILIWAASHLVEAADRGLPTSRLFRFAPHQLLTAIGRSAGSSDYRLLRTALGRLQSTVVRTSIRQGEGWRARQFSWLAEWEERVGRAGRSEGVEFVLPDWFYRGVLDRRLVLTVDPAYFALTGGIERWLYRVARKHAGRQPAGWRFDLRQLHAKSASQRRISDFAVDLRRIAARQPLPGYHVQVSRRREHEDPRQIVLLRPVGEAVDNHVGGLETHGRSRADRHGRSRARNTGDHAHAESMRDQKTPCSQQLRLALPDANFLTDHHNSSVVGAGSAAGQRVPEVLR